MKRLIILAALLFILPSISKAQSEDEFQDEYRVHCEGEYLTHLDFNNQLVKFKLILKKNTAYGIYIFKKEDEEIPQLKITNKDNIDMQDFEVETNHETYKYYKFIAPKGGVYKFSFKNKESDTLPSGIMAIYHQSERQSIKIIINTRD